MSMSRDFGRRESVMVIPSMDSVLDGYGRGGGPMDRSDVTFIFRVVGSDQDAAYDLLAAQVAPGVPQRLVYQPDNPVAPPWFTIGSNPRIQHTLTAAGRGLVPHCDFTVTWRIRPDWRPRFSESAQVFHSSTVFVAATTFGSIGSTTIASAFQPFNVTATGTAGLDLPTLDDSGPTITVVGPAGGDGGFRISSGSAFAVDTNGTRQGLSFDVPYKLVDGNQSVTLKFAAQTFLYNGIAFRPTKPAYQREWFRIKAGIINSCLFSPLGANALTSGKISVDWYRKRA